MRIFITLIALAGFIAAPAHAATPQEEGYYAGGVIGFSTFDDDDLGDDFDADLTDFSGIWGAFGGYRWSQYLETEGRFTYLGDGAADAKLKTTALTANVIGVLPVTNNGFEVFGQLGIGYAFINDDLDKDSIGAESLDNEIVYTIGAGLRLWPTETVALTAAYDYYAFESDVESEDYDLAYGLFKLGIKFMF
ncbi:MAG: outer membrane beta-barrel protein [Gammaproteobacteria bacterium]